jgi:phosphohistidine phosphatase
LVVRHGIALRREKAEERQIADRDRSLTKKGRARFEQVARGIANQVPELRAIVTSSLRRAHETGAILCDVYGDVNPTQTDALLPDAAPEALAHLLADDAFESPVAVVGHEPHLSSFISWCVTGNTNAILQLKKGGAALLHFPNAPGSGTGHLVWLYPPSVLRRLR